MQIFSPVLKSQLKDCILAIFWPKKEIYRFLKDCSVPAQILKAVEDWEGKELSRRQIVDDVFDALTDRADNGTVHFNFMLDTLSEWTQFDDYWFNVRQELDLSKAKEKVAALKFGKENSINKTKARNTKERAKALAREEKFNSLEEMRLDFQTLSMGSETAQKRGYAFESFLTKMMRYAGLQVTDSFRIKGTQIDGTVKYDGEFYNIEAKWHDRSLSDEPLLAFCHKQEINMHGRGMFISVNGYTDGALHLLERSHVKNTILFDGEDIALILNEMTSLSNAMETKIRSAQTRGLFYVNPVDGKSKFAK